MHPSLPTREFREHTDLPQLKRQAKELLEAYRGGDAAAAAEVKAHYRGADPAVFALHDAQLVIARAYGFVSWPKLKAYVDGVNTKQLVAAVQAGDAAKVEAMLSARPELVNMDMGENERRAIHFAVMLRQPAIVRLLMRHGADARKGVYPHRDATSALTLAIDRGYDEIATIIREEEGTAPGEDPLPEGWTALHTAAFHLDEDAVGLLLAEGADPNRLANGLYTPLDAAASTRGWDDYGELEKFRRVAQLLLRHGAAASPMGAVAMGDIAAVRELSEKGSLATPTSLNIFKDPAGLLTIAVLHDKAEMVTLLLDLGFDADERRRIGGMDEIVYTAGAPLLASVDLERREIAEILLARGADPNAVVYTSGSPFYKAHAKKDAYFIELLGKHGGFLDAISAGYACQTEAARQLLADEAAGRLRAGSVAPGKAVAEELLWTGAGGGDPEIVRMALEHIDWPSTDMRWHWPMWQAFTCDGGIEKGLPSFRMLLERADPNLADDGRTILHTIMARGGPECVPFAELLLEKGARTDLRDHLLQSTALGWACRWGRDHFVKLLLDRGVDPLEREAEPWATPEAWARKRNHPHILELLAR